MKIVGIQLSNRRRDKRVSVMPIQIELEGKVYTAIDWSLGGFLIEVREPRRAERGRAFTTIPMGIPHRIIVSTKTNHS